MTICLHCYLCHFTDDILILTDDSSWTLIYILPLVWLNSYVAYTIYIARIRNRSHDTNKIN